MPLTPNLKICSVKIQKFKKRVYLHHQTKWIGERTVTDIAESKI